MRALLIRTRWRESPCLPCYRLPGSSYLARDPLAPIRREQLPFLLRQLPIPQQIGPSLPRAAQRLLQPPRADRRVVPRQQHVRHPRARVLLRPRVMRAIEQPGDERILRRPNRRRSARPAAAARSRRSASAPATLRPTRRNRRSRSPRPLRARAAARRCPRSVRRAARVPSSRRPPQAPPPAGASAARPPATGSNVRVAAQPSACLRRPRRPKRLRSGSASITIPGPPPYGRSSTVRCLSVTKSRGFQTPSRHSPRCSARPVTPNRAACPTISGNSVTTSIRILRSGRGQPRSVIRAPIDDDPAARPRRPVRRSPGRAESTAPAPAHPAGAPRATADARRARTTPCTSPSRIPARFITGKARQVVPVDLAFRRRRQHRPRRRRLRNPSSSAPPRAMSTPASAATSVPECRRPSSLRVLAPRSLRAPASATRSRSASSVSGDFGERPDLDRAAHAVRSDDIAQHDDGVASRAIATRCGECPPRAPSSWRDGGAARPARQARRAGGRLRRALHQAGDGVRQRAPRSCQNAIRSTASRSASSPFAAIGL